MTYADGHDWKICTWTCIEVSPHIASPLCAWSWRMGITGLGKPHYLSWKLAALGLVGSGWASLIPDIYVVGSGENWTVITENLEPQRTSFPLFWSLQCKGQTVFHGLWARGDGGRGKQQSCVRKRKRERRTGRKEVKKLAIRRKRVVNKKIKSGNQPLPPAAVQERN